MRLLFVVSKAQVIQVIKTESLRGEGTKEDSCRIVTQYWDFDGNLLAESDPCIAEGEQTACVGGKECGRTGSDECIG